MINLYPLNLVLAAALAWAMIFLGNLPTRLIGAPVFVRQVFRAGWGWMIVALISPASIRHFHVLIGLVALIAWWKLRGDHALVGKLWLAASSALGISLGVVLILAVSSPAWTLDATGWSDALRIMSVYLGGAILGLACTVFVFTRREATHAGLPSATLERLVQLLVVLTFIRAALQIAALFQKIVPFTGGMMPSEHFPGLPASPAGTSAAFFCLLLVSPVLAMGARRRSRSPAPSTAGPPLLILCVIGVIAESLNLY